MWGQKSILEEAGQTRLENVWSQTSRISFSAWGEGAVGRQEDPWGDSHKYPAVDKACRVYSVTFPSRKPSVMRAFEFISHRSQINSSQSKRTLSQLMACDLQFLTASLPGRCWTSISTMSHFLQETLLYINHWVCFSGDSLMTTDVEMLFWNAAETRIVWGKVFWIQNTEWREVCDRKNVS